MANITEKELSAISDLMSAEVTMKAKCAFMAEKTTDRALADCYLQMARQHQKHLDELYSNLK